MKLSALIIFLTSTLFFSCDPHARHVFKVDNSGSQDVEVIYTLEGMEIQDTLVAAGDLIYIHASNSEACIDSLEDEAFALLLESFLVMRGMDTLNFQVPGDLNQWDYEQTDNSGALLSPCSGEGTYTFPISDSLYPI